MENHDGLVIKNTGSWYLVKINDRIVPSKIKGNFRLKEIKSTNPVAVGDMVRISVGNENTGLITHIHERKNYIIRRSSNLSKQSHIIASNLDGVLLIVTVSQPQTSTTFIDRFLASTQAYRVPTTIVINKIDTYNDEESAYADALISLYQNIGYSCLKISALKHIGLEELKESLKNKTTLLSGHSGVGKSTLINQLIPDITLKTAPISNYHQKGMHTTTFSEMLELPQGGYIIDTPGIKGFGTIDMEKNEIYHFFPDLFHFSQYCRFNNCLHLQEPGCEVIKAVEQQLISQSRYTSYLSMMNDDENQKYRQ